MGAHGYRIRQEYHARLLKDEQSCNHSSGNQMMRSDDQHLILSHSLFGYLLIQIRQSSFTHAFRAERHWMLMLMMFITTL